MRTTRRSITGPYGDPFGNPKSTKIGPKTIPNLIRFSRAKKLVFKSLLGPSWADLGPLRSPKSCCGSSGARFLKKHHFSTNRTCKPNLAAKSANNDPKMDPQNDPKSTKNQHEKIIKILIEKKTISPQARRNARAEWGDYRGANKPPFVITSLCSL